MTTLFDYGSTYYWNMAIKTITKETQPIDLSKYMYWLDDFYEIYHVLDCNLLPGKLLGTEKINKNLLNASDGALTKPMAKENGGKAWILKICMARNIHSTTRLFYPLLQTSLCGGLMMPLQNIIPI